MIRYPKLAHREKLPTRQVQLSFPRPGAEYTHHSSICRFGERFYAIWSGGFIGEDEIGQHVMMSASDDGLHWEEPRPLIIPADVQSPQGLLFAGGLYSHAGRLVAYFGHVIDDVQLGLAEGAIRCRDIYWGYVTTEDGVNWSAPVRTELAFVPNHGPQMTSSGRLIACGNIMFPYSDDLTGTGVFQPAGIYGDLFRPGEERDDPDIIHTVTPARGWDCHLICEGSFYEMDDGTLRMLLRSNSGCLWLTESRDGGGHWSDPAATEFPDEGSKFHCGRLPDGRYYVVSNATPGGFSGRRQLVISLSRDGECFDQQYILRDEPVTPQFTAGRWKGGTFAYPHTLVWEGKMYIIYSVNKERIEVTILELQDLPDMKQ